MIGGLSQFIIFNFCTHLFSPTIIGSEISFFHLLIFNFFILIFSFLATSFNYILTLSLLSLSTSQSQRRNNHICSFVLFLLLFLNLWFVLFLDFRFQISLIIFLILNIKLFFMGFYLFYILQRKKNCLCLYVNIYIISFFKKTKKQ